MDGAMDGGNPRTDGSSRTMLIEKPAASVDTSGWWCRLSASADRFWPANNWIVSETSAKRLSAKRGRGTLNAGETGSRVGTPGAKDRKQGGRTPLRKRAVEIAAGESGSHVRLELSSTGQACVCQPPGGGRHAAIT